MIRRQIQNITAVLCAAILVTVSGCKPATAPTVNTVTEEPAELVVNTNEVAVIETRFGKMVMEFFYADAPQTVANFKKLARKGFYDGTTFHRIVSGFMIQGGDPQSKDPNNLAVGGGGPGYSIKAEFNPQKHVLGVVSMARSSSPDSAGSQFFICLDEADQLDGHYTAFGKLIAGIDVLKKIGDVPTKMDPSSQERSVPLDRVVIDKVRIVPRDEAVKPAP